MGADDGNRVAIVYADYAGAERRARCGDRNGKK
jgi:hypothetical protein